MKGWAAGLLLLGGCTLIDQTTFNSHAADAPVIPPAPPVAARAPAGPPALVVIAPGADYRKSLDQAVAAARARKADVVFNVVEIEPGDAVVPTSADAEAVARAIIAGGIPPGRVRLVARPGAGRQAREIRVYVQ